MVHSPTERPAEGDTQAARAAERRERDREAHRDELDWEGFKDQYYPDSGRHDLEAIVAYGLYKKSPPAGPQPASEVPSKAGAMPAETPALDEWEDEGGASH